MESSFGVSVIVPVGHSKAGLTPSLRATCESVAEIPTEHKELIFTLDEGISDAFSRDPDLVFFPFARILKHKGPKGMRATRMNAIREARYDHLLFVDDDSMVSRDWAARLFELTQEYGIAGGPIKAIAQNTIYAKLEGLIDRYRAEATTSEGKPKFISFSNVGMRKDLLPKIPFDEVENLYGNDMDLGCRLRVLDRPIHIAQDLPVRTQYPMTLSGVLKRKLRHAKGIAYTERRMGPKRWADLEIGDHATIVRRWIGISLKARVSLKEKFIFLIMNMTYALGLIYYFNISFKGVTEISSDDL